ncbi:HlyD family efflux transporter periplasmic adaptor subunit [Marinomonas sp. TW1]|uniref:HlyD family efflux transporter periplasmic adaptor subunit n=1 Tax=Marinomonas sp. TW1 TaxID=1561203 RepID=UPI0007AF83AE|nr:HlyD family efflux transporter periplasmic adaptor subunit [Marinomonas sp. TW1]KZN12266.1 peptidase M50 [Marinomonas sp. TW1]
MLELNSSEWASLREDLRLFEGPADAFGAPTWTLEDPVSGRFYRLDWFEMEVLARWSFKNAQVIASDICQQLTLFVSTDDVKVFYDFLKRHRLLNNHVSSPSETNADGLSPVRWLLRHYLFFRIPLCRPDVFLEKSLPFVRFFFSQFFLLLSLFAAVLGLFLVSRQWQSFTHTYMHFFSVEGMLALVMALFFTKSLHELGHAYTCKYYGGNVATMGVALLVLWPVLYTDTSSAWRLKKKRQRVLIGAAGVIVELIVGAWALLLWNFMPEGIGKSLAFMLGTTTWMLSLLINLSPFIRFDGYFLLSDVLGIANLQARAFDYTRWQIREWIFSFQHRPPEVFSATKRRILIAYTLITWLYRFFLYIGIALMVYHFAFKLLGIFLFIVEMLVFIVFPVFRELRVWYQMRKEMSWNKRSIGSVLLCALMLFVFCYPWQGQISAPAVIRASQQVNMYVPANAQLRYSLVGKQQKVVKGQALFEFVSPELNQETDRLNLRLARLQKQADVNPFNEQASASLNAIREERLAAQQRLEVIQQQLMALTLKAPFDGTMISHADRFREGDWLAAGERLGVMVSPHSNTVEAYIKESDVSRIDVHSMAYFVPESLSYPKQALTLEHIENIASTKLTSAPELASVYGGRVAASMAQNDQVPIAEEAVYRAFLTPMDSKITATGVVLRGEVYIDAKAESFMSKVLKRAMSVLVRESSF